MSASPLQKYTGLSDSELDGMIQFTRRTYKFLDITSPEALRQICSLMLAHDFLRGTKSTPVRSSYDFLRKVAEQARLKLPITERDFVFALKMFGLRIIEEGRIYLFPADNKVASTDKEIPIDNAKEAKQVEFHISDVHSTTKIQRQAIESATNRLLRSWKEWQLAQKFVDMVNSGHTIGEAQDYLRIQVGVIPSEYQRIRKFAEEMGFKSKRRSRQTNRRITLEEDNVEFVSLMGEQLSKGRNPMTLTESTNRVLRDMREMISDKAKKIASKK